MDCVFSFHGVQTGILMKILFLATTFVDCSFGALSGARTAPEGVPRIRGIYKTLIFLVVFHHLGEVSVRAGERPTRPARGLAGSPPGPCPKCL